MGLPPLKQLIEAHGLLAKKSLGQHFLLDGRITDRIAEAGGDLSQCCVFEIGPGPGGLTRSLLKAGAKKLFVVEKDARCLPILDALKDYSEGRMEIIVGDGLKTDLTILAPAPRKIIANLPYNVGTAMLLYWLEAIYQDGMAFESMTLMFQKEVAKRIIAEPGGKDYGRLSVLCQWLCECREDLELPPSAFTPPPKVSSMVVTLIPRPKPLVDVNKATLEKVLAAAFGQRRKMLRSSLKTLDTDTEKMLARAGIMGSLRAEQLDVVTLCRLAQAYQNALL